jgi:hypothetical protein
MICKEFYKSIGLSKPKPLEKIDRIKFNRYVFKNIFQPRMKDCPIVELNKKDKSFIEDFAKRKVIAKSIESGTDNHNRIKREMTGACIEYGLLKFFNKEDKFDDSIVDKSYKRNHPDLLPLGIVCDVKGSSINNVPLVFKTCRLYTCGHESYFGKKYRCSNLIGITDYDKVWLLGVASPRVLEDYSDDNLIMMADNRTKTGFFGVNQLKDLPDEWLIFKDLCSMESLIL